MRRRFSVAIPAVALALVASGCGGSSNGAKPVPGGSSGSASAPAGTTSSTSSAAPNGSQAAIDVCSLITKDAASTAARQSFSSASPSTLAKGVYSCDYSGGSAHWSVTVYQSPSTATLDTLLMDLGGASAAHSVAGIGDQAYVSPVAVAATFGDRLIEVGSPYNSPSNEPGYESLAKAAIAALT